MARRNRYVILTVIIAVLVVIYLATGASSTQKSQFYSRTVNMMDTRGRGAEIKEPSKRWPNIADPGEATQENIRSALRNSNVHELGDKTPLGESPEVMTVEHHQAPEQSLRDRLKEAEKVAKKSADEKYRALRDIEAEVIRERQARSSVAAAIAAAATKAAAIANSGHRILEPGEKSVAGRTKMKVDKAEASKPQTTETLIPLHATTDYQSPLTPQPGETTEERELRETYASILTASPVIIFSKSYCPFSKKAKRILLESYTITPSPKVVELDEHPLGPQLQALLTKLTGRRTVPNVLVEGKTIGGGDEVEMLWRSGEMPARLRQMSGRKVKKVMENIPYEKTVKRV